MRNYKFRGIGLYNRSKMIYGNYHYDGKFHYILPFNDDDILYVNYQVKPETVGQFTGFLDANGIEIFEGDIVVDETDLPYAKSLSYEEIIENTKKERQYDFLIVKYGLEEVDAFYGMAYNIWSFQGNDNGERLARGSIVIGNIHQQPKP